MNNDTRIAAALAALTNDEVASLISTWNALKASGLPRTFNLSQYKMSVLLPALRELASRGATANRFGDDIMIHAGAVNLDLGERPAHEIASIEGTFLPRASDSLADALHGIAKAVAR